MKDIIITIVVVINNCLFNVDYSKEFTDYVIINIFIHFQQTNKQKQNMCCTFVDGKFVILDKTQLYSIEWTMLNDNHDLNRI